jgi:hypothetical protein
MAIKNAEGPEDTYLSSTAKISGMETPVSQHRF